MNGPGANYVPELMEGSNHFQMRNDSNTRDAMEAIFDDGLGKEFFITERR